MREVRPKMPVGNCAGNGVTIDACGGFENVAAFSGGIGGNRRLFFLLNPGVEIGTRIDVYAQQHLGVLHAAILSTLTEEQASLVRIDPSAVRMVGNQVRLAGETRNPKAVVGVGRKQ